MRKLRKKAALIAAIVLFLQSTVGVYTSAVVLPAVAATDTDEASGTTGSDQSGDASEAAGSQSDSSDSAAADDGDRGSSNDSAGDNGTGDISGGDEQDGSDSKEQGGDDIDSESGEEAEDPDAVENELEEAEETEKAYTYVEGEKVYVLDLNEGDTVEKGVILFPYTDSVVKEEKNLVELSDEIVPESSLSEGEDQEFVAREFYVFYTIVSGGRKRLNEDPSEDYTTEDSMRLSKKSINYEAGTVSLTFEPIYDKDGDHQTTKRGKTVEVDSMQLGDTVSAKATIALGEESKFTSFDVFLDENEGPVNEEKDTYTFNQKARLIGKSVASDDSEKLELVFESFYAKGEVGSEEALRLALETDEKIIIANDIPLTDNILIADGKEHFIELDGYTLSGRPKYRETTGGLIEIMGNSSLTITDSSEDQAGTLCDGWAIRGGAIMLTSGKFTMEGGTITKCKAAAGGAILCGGEMVLKNVKLIDNEALIENSGDEYLKGQGGAITLASGADCNFEGCEISGNRGMNGGGIDAQEGKLVMTDCTVKDNYASNVGSGIHVVGEVELHDCDVSGNTGRNGGGIGNQGKLLVDGCLIEGNSVISSGGGIYSQDSSTVTRIIGKTEISNNTAGFWGGGVYDHNCAKLEIEDSEIRGNAAQGDGGGIHAQETVKINLTGVSITDNSSEGFGGGLRCNFDTRLDGCYIGSNFCKGDGGGVYYGVKGGKHNLTLKDTEITGNICELRGAGLWMAQDGSTTNLILEGGRIRITGNKVNNNGVSTDNNLSFYSSRSIRMTGKLDEDSMIGFDMRPIIETIYVEDESWAAFIRRMRGEQTEKVARTNVREVDRFQLTKDYGDYNDEPTDTYFTSDNLLYRINPDDQISEVEVIKKLIPSAEGYQIRVTIKVTNDANDWNGALCQVYAKENYGRGKEKFRTGSDDITRYIDHKNGSYDSGQKWCGTDFPTKVNIYADFGSRGVIFRDWEADVKVWINDVNVASTHICSEVYGRTKNEGKADNWIYIGEGNYPYPEDFEIEQKREIDLSDENSKIVTLTAVDQYGCRWTSQNKGDFEMENMSYPGQDTFECIDKEGLKWKFDTTKLDTCHNSKYQLRFKSGSSYREWNTIDIVVRFKIPLYVTVRVGNEDVGYKEVQKIPGHQNDVVFLTTPEVDAGFVLNKVKKESGCNGLVSQDKNGSYKFTFMSTNAVVSFETKGITYKISYNRNASSDKIIVGNMRDKRVTYSSPYVLERNIYKGGPGHEGEFVFAGWNTEPDGSGTAYENEAVVKNLTTTAGEVITLYAQWQDKEGNKVTASIFSDGYGAIYGGIVVAAVLSVLMGCVISVRRRRRR